MDPITATIGIIGLGLQTTSLFGGMDSSHKMSELSRQDYALQMQANLERKKQMELMARRQQMETLRNSQRARSISLANASAQGAQFGSGLSGGYGQIAGMTNTNLLGIGQNLEIGRNLFNIDTQRSALGVEQSKVAEDAAFWKGLGGLGKNMLSWMEPVKNLTGSNAYRNGQPSSYFTPGGYGFYG